MKCGRKSKLEAHHLMLKSKHPEVKFYIKNGITLCEDCHKDFHFFERLKEQAENENKKVQDIGLNRKYKRRKCNLPVEVQSKVLNIWDGVKNKSEETLKTISNTLKIDVNEVVNILVMNKRLIEKWNKS